MIKFSPPYITRKEITSVKKVLKSGWITTGKINLKFEQEINKYLNTKNTILFNSATSAMESILRYYSIGDGDEVITTPYTFAATVNIIEHIKAKIIFCDVKKDSFHMDTLKLEKLINKKTKAIISVDIVGWPVDYDNINKIIEKKKDVYKPKKNSRQENFGKILFLSDAAHSFGSLYNNKYIGNHADFTAFSFHAVKNITTAEGGALVINNFSDPNICKELKIYSLHGQTVNAFEKYNNQKIYYDIIYPGYKNNMPDINAALGLSQLLSYKKQLLKREKIFNLYNDKLKNIPGVILPRLKNSNKKTNCHLYLLRFDSFDEEKRNKFLIYLKENSIQANIHFLPIPMFSYYKNLGYDIGDYPESYESFKKEISLPIYPNLKLRHVKFIIDKILNYFK